jgi:hypothetical protein
MSAVVDWQGEPLPRRHDLEREMVTDRADAPISLAIFGLATVAID